MEKYLVTIEFRYNDAPKYESESPQSFCKTITLGVYDNRDEANNCGNKCLEVLESKFKLNPNYNKKERFSNTGGCFGYPKDLITDLAYLVTPFSFFVKITKLVYYDLNEIIKEVTEASLRYNKYNKYENN